jgi:ATP-dependent protease ClpP protease subunit
MADRSAKAAKDEIGEPGVRESDALKVEYRLTFASDISLDTANSLRSRIAEILEQSDFGALTILFSSEGGSCDQSLALYNYISALPVPVQMHAMGHVGSASVPVFLASRKRTCARHARFFFHEYDWTFEGSQTLRRITEAVERLSNDIELAQEIIKTSTKAGPDIISALDGTASPKILLPEEAKLLGFVDDVGDLKEATSDGMPFVVWTV